MTTKGKVYEIIQDTILKKLEEGVIPWRKTWSGCGGDPKNIITNKAYRSTNNMLLQCQGYKSPYWMTFNQVKKLKGTLLKGSKSSIVTYYKILEKENDAGVVEERFPMLRYYRVFNLEQTEGIIPKWDEEITEFTENDPIVNCEKVVNEMREFPKMEWGINPCYSPSKDRIGMPELKQFNSSEEYYATYFHEMAHSTKHMQRMNRQQHSYAKEELIAEMSSCFICGKVGIESATIDNTAAYIQSWIKHIKENDVKMVVQAAAEAQKVADWIMNISDFTEMKKTA